MCSTPHPPQWSLQRGSYARVRDEKPGEEVSRRCARDPERLELARQHEPWQPRTVQASRRSGSASAGRDGPEEPYLASDAEDPAARCFKASAMAFSARGFRSAYPFAFGCTPSSLTPSFICPSLPTSAE